MQAFRNAFLAFAASSAMFMGGASAHEVTMPAEERVKPYTGQLPQCADPQVLDTIRDRFEQRETGYWNSSLIIDRIERIGATAYRPWGRDFIPRRFCHARAVLSNGKRHALRYSIIEDGGIIGYTWGVQWCVIGLDRNMHFAPECRAAKP
jgi:hypothetical protein